MMEVLFNRQGSLSDFAKLQGIGMAMMLRTKASLQGKGGELVEDDGIQMLQEPLARDSFRVLPPSTGRDENWHVTDEGDTMVAHCYGLGHDIKEGEALARRIAACLNFCRGMDTELLEKLLAPNPLPHPDANPPA
jgi:hypothetical protein